VLALVNYLSEQHCATLANPHRPRAEGKRSRFPYLLARFTRREPKQWKEGEGRP
jgi:hypothetical protein